MRGSPPGNERNAQSRYLAFLKGRHVSRQKNAKCREIVCIEVVIKVKSEKRKIILCKKARNQRLRKEGLKKRSESDE